MPVVRELPFKWLYPAEADHESEVDAKHAGALRETPTSSPATTSTCASGCPRTCRGKWVVTNTTTAEDVEFLRARGVELLVTSTPRLEGRSFGTNVIEATLVALDGAKAAAVLRASTWRCCASVGFTPRRAVAAARAEGRRGGVGPEGV